MVAENLQERFQQLRRKFDELSDELEGVLDETDQYDTWMDFFSAQAEQLIPVLKEGGRNAVQSLQQELDNLQTRLGEEQEEFRERVDDQIQRLRDTVGELRERVSSQLNEEFNEGVLKKLRDEFDNISNSVEEILDSVLSGKKN